MQGETQPNGTIVKDKYILKGFGRVDEQKINAKAADTKKSTKSNGKSGS